uniref:Uncharacterized protein n=1 Tax=Rhodnius prolixus TaxID=13249 RepID=T1I5J6_RHOPR
MVFYTIILAALGNFEMLGICAEHVIPVIQ